jgi:hypothetical protein
LAPSSLAPSALALSAQSSFYPSPPFSSATMYLGGYRAAENHAILVAAGVTHVLTVANNLEDLSLFPGHIC